MLFYQRQADEVLDGTRAQTITQKVDLVYQNRHKVAVTQVGVDSREKKLEIFLKGKKSPLVDYAGLIVRTADQYGIDWRLLTAIAGIESSFGIHIPKGSYNAYGWANGAYRFRSWEHSIDHVSKILAQKYYQKGLDTPRKIAPVYAPPSKHWAGAVNKFIQQIENTVDRTEIVQAQKTIALGIGSKLLF